MSAARGPRAAALCALAVVALGGCGGTSAKPAATQAVPSDFLGLVSDQVFSATPLWKARILATQRHAGVELLRQEFAWAQIEPRPGVYDFAPYDAYMAATAGAGMQVLAVLDDPPAWAATKPPRGERLSEVTVFPPRKMAQFAAFAALLARRYGPGGSFWRAHPKLRAVPIRSWEIWNEPNFEIYWGGHPSAAAYAAMLRAVYPAIHAVDPHANIVTAGVANTTIGGIGAEPYIRELLATRPRPAFDTLAIHAYAINPAGVIESVEQVRGILNAAGLNSTPIWLTEFGWASGGPPSPFTVGSARQARYVLDTIVDLARKEATLHVAGIVYYDWQDAVPYAGGGTNLWGFHTGLVAIDGIAKPALSSYYQAAGVLHAPP